MGVLNPDSHSSKLLGITEVVIGVDQRRLRIDNLGNRNFMYFGVLELEQGGQAR